MRLAIVHETVYRFDTPATRAIQTLRLTPRTTEAQLVDSWRIDVSQDCRLSPVEDAFGNLTHSFSIDGPIDELSIVASGEVATEDTAGVLHATRERLPLAVFRRATDRTPIEGSVRDFARTALTESGGDPLSALHLIMGRLHESIPPFETRRRLAGAARGAGGRTGRHRGRRPSLRRRGARPRHAGALASPAISTTRPWPSAMRRTSGSRRIWATVSAGSASTPSPTPARPIAGSASPPVSTRSMPSRSRGVRTHFGAETTTTRIVIREIARA